GGAWSDWMALEVDLAEAPDPREAAPTDRRTSRPLWVDRADAVELSLPVGVDGLTLHRVREPERLVVTGTGAVAGATPSILPRSAWGAAAYRGQPVYSPVKLAIVHHSVNANGYGAGEVPGIIRSMQRHHQDANGWDDIAYNFLVDR